MPIRPLKVDHSIDTDIGSILSGASFDSSALSYSIIIQTPNEEIPIDTLISIEQLRDYANNICDHTLVSFTIAAGLYIKRVLPHIDNLEIILITQRYGHSYKDRYKLLIANGPSNTAGTMYSSYSEAELNKMDQFVIEGQCLNRLVEALRYEQVNGVYNKTTVKDVMTTLYHNAISNIKIGGTPSLANVDIVAPNNARVYDHISVPTGVNLLDLPTYLQLTHYGVYNGDIGTYIQRYGYFTPTNTPPKDTVFIYPLYNNLRTDELGKKLSIFATPTTQLSKIDRSFIVDGDVIKIIGGGDMTANEITQTKLMDGGNAAIVSSPSNIMLGKHDTTDSTAKVNSKDNVTGVRFKTKVDGVDGAKYISPRDNIYKVHSEVAKNALSPYQVTWNFSNPELLHPGMPVTYIYQDAELGVIKLTGTLHSCFNKYVRSNKAWMTILNILLEPIQEGVTKHTTVVDARR